MNSSSTRCACERHMPLVAFVTITTSTYLYCIYYVSGTELRSNKQTYGSSKSVTDRQSDPYVVLCFLGTTKITRGATVTGCAPVVSFCCKGGQNESRRQNDTDMGKKCKSLNNFFPWGQNDTGAKWNQGEKWYGTWVISVNSVNY